MLVSLTALWGFAAWVTVADGVNLLWATTIDEKIAQPSEPLLWALQTERRLSVATLAAGSGRTELAGQRRVTDEARSVFDTSAQDNLLSWAADDNLKSRIAELREQLGKLVSLRRDVDGGRLTRQQAQADYDDLIERFYRMYDAVAALDDQTIARDGRTLAALSKSRELLSRQDSLVTGILADGTVSAADRTAITRAAALHAYTLQQAALALPAADRATLDAWAGSKPVTQLRAMERVLTAPTAEDQPATVTAQAWRTAADSALQTLNSTVQTAGDVLVERAVPVAVGVLIRLVLAGVLGLVAVVASIVVTITTTRALLKQLGRLRDAALDLADRRLPGVVERIGQGQEVDLAVEAPPLPVGDDEIGRVAEAFNTVQATAITVAAGQAELRRSTRDILHSLARRTQGLVSRQLTVLDQMQHRATEPTELADLFALDHLAVRARRNAENLLVLSGAAPGRIWNRSVPLLALIRAAQAEVEDYTRVTIAPLGQEQLAGRAVSDVMHLIAELIENAVSFSPPDTEVLITGQRVANGYVLEVEDRGLGMSEADLAEANQRIADPPEFRLTGGTARLGFHVVSQLAARHRIRVTLKESPYGGTTVIVLMPHDLVLDTDASPSANDAAPPLPIRNRTAILAGPSPATPPVVQPAETPIPAVDAVRAEEGEHPPAHATLPERTPSGLPVRVAQAGLAEGLRGPAPEPAPRPEVNGDTAAELRDRMASLQRGTSRGRAAAEHAPAFLFDQPGADGHQENSR
ncbi:nitrate- and nitrite sensing domain-containing protein [Nonomuraea sp. NBC_01738]|uniref:sensor histidine kinase n=1 Tax=Nonomuraea sp. NBC_01738 TaxID=2976003 RepID=UPI002E0EDAA9|nr:nitrate- and nitrite sensing domain-containing protein [Nonomuraea sp. NBC_01738]